MTLPGNPVNLLTTFADLDASPSLNLPNLLYSLHLPPPLSSPFGLVNDYERGWNQTLQNELPTARDSPFQVPNTSRCPDRERSSSRVVLLLHEGFLNQDLAPPLSRSQEEVPDLNGSLVLGLETFELDADSRGGIATRLQGFPHSGIGGR